jgi:hypothetical protein
MNPLREIPEDEKTTTKDTRPRNWYQFEEYNDTLQGAQTLVKGAMTALLALGQPFKHKVPEQKGSRPHLHFISAPMRTEWVQPDGKKHIISVNVVELKGKVYINFQQVRELRDLLLSGKEAGDKDYESLKEFLRRERVDEGSKFWSALCGQESIKPEPVAQKGAKGLKGQRRRRRRRRHRQQQQQQQQQQRYACPGRGRRAARPRRPALPRL